MMMEQNAKRAGRQTQEFYPEPDGTECHKSRETSPVTLPRTRRNQKMIVELNAKRLGRQAPKPYREPEGTRK